MNSPNAIQPCWSAFRARVRLPDRQTPVTLPLLVSNLGKVLFISGNNSPGHEPPCERLPGVSVWQSSRFNAIDISLLLPMFA